MTCRLITINSWCIDLTRQDYFEKKKKKKIVWYCIQCILRFMHDRQFIYISKFFFSFFLNFPRLSSPLLPSFSCPSPLIHNFILFTLPGIDNSFYSKTLHQWIVVNLTRWAKEVHKDKVFLLLRKVSDYCACGHDTKKFLFFFLGEIFLFLTINKDSDSNIFNQADKQTNRQTVGQKKKKNKKKSEPFFLLSLFHSFSLSLWKI